MTYQCVKLVVGLISLILLAGASSGADLIYEEIGVFTYPTDESYLDFHVADLDGDGYDDIVVLFPHTLFVYSPATDSMLLHFEDGGLLSGILVDSVDDNQYLDILLLQGHTRPHLLAFYDGEATPDTVGRVDYLAYQNMVPSPASMALHDLDLDLGRLLVVSRLGWHLLGDGGCRIPCYNERMAGDLQVLTFPDLVRMRRTVYGSSQHMEFLDLGEEGMLDAVGRGKLTTVVCTPDFYWGSCYTDWTHRQGLTVSTALGDSLWKATSPWAYAVAVGDMTAVSPGQEIAVLARGSFCDSAFFVPSEPWAFYGLRLENDSLKPYWAVDFEQGYHSLSYLASLEGRFLVDTEGPDQIRSGDDGSFEGHVFGLRDGWTLAEGRFSPSVPIDSVQPVQLHENQIAFFGPAHPTAVDDSGPSAVPSGYRLHSNYPNPFNSHTTIEFEAPRRATIALEVFNLLGQKVRTLVRAESTPHGAQTVS